MSFMSDTKPDFEDDPVFENRRISSRVLRHKADAAEAAYADAGITSDMRMHVKAHGSWTHLEAPPFDVPVYILIEQTNVDFNERPEIHLVVAKRYANEISFNGEKKWRTFFKYFYVEINYKGEMLIIDQMDSNSVDVVAWRPYDAYPPEEMKKKFEALKQRYEAKIRLEAFMATVEKHRSRMP